MPKHTYVHLTYNQRHSAAQKRRTAQKNELQETLAFVGLFVCLVVGYVLLAA